MIDPDLYFICRRDLATGEVRRGMFQYDKAAAEHLAAYHNTKQAGRAFYFIMPGSAVLQIVRGLASKELAERD